MNKNIGSAVISNQLNVGTWFKNNDFNTKRTWNKTYECFYILQEKHLMAYTKHETKNRTLTN